MKAIIMAAGKGSRISQKIDGIPKSTVRVNDVPVIRGNVSALLDAGFEVVVCTGYKNELVEAALEGLQVRYYHNPFFEVTNNIANFWFMREELDGKDDLLLLSADLYYPRAFLEKFEGASRPISMLTDSSRIYDGDFYFDLTEDGSVKAYGPQLPLARRSCEYVGFTYIKKEFVSEFASEALGRIDAGSYQTYFEDIALSFALSGRAELQCIDVAGSFWREFDFYEDYELICEHARMAAEGNDGEYSHYFGR